MGHTVRVDRRPPAYEDLAAVIRDKIRSGHYQPASRLPSLRDLEVRYDVSSTTVRAAYRLLRAQGWVESVHGSGMYVAPSTPDEQPQSLPDQVAELRDELHALRDRVADLERGQRGT